VTGALHHIIKSYIPLPKITVWFKVRGYITRVKWRKFKVNSTSCEQVYWQWLPSSFVCCQMTSYFEKTKNV